MRAALLLLALGLAACGADGPPLRPDGTPESALVDGSRDERVSTSARWDAAP